MKRREPARLSPHASLPRLQQEKAEVVQPPDTVPRRTQSRRAPQQRIEGKHALRGPPGNVRHRSAQDEWGGCKRQGADRMQGSLRMRREKAAVTKSACRANARNRIGARQVLIERPWSMSAVARETKTVAVTKPRALLARICTKRKPAERPSSASKRDVVPPRRMRTPRPELNIFHTVTRGAAASFATHAA